MTSEISSPDFHKLKRHKMGDKNDVISNLPDSILHYILSLLPIKDAVRTSILAKSWKYLWTFLSIFDFEIHLPRSCEKEEQILRKSANCLLDLVDRLLHQSDCIKGLHVAIYGITVDAERVNSVISAALKCKVDDLNLSLDFSTPFELSHSFSASESLNKLCLELGCVLNIPSGIRFPSLKTLNISCVTFANEKSVQQLFSGCLVLQELTLYNCDWKNIKKISLTIPTLRILTIYYDPFTPDIMLNCTVKIDAVNLSSFSITSYLTVEFVLVNLNSILDAHIDVLNFYESMRRHAAHRVIKLLRGVAGVKSLELSNNTIECLFYAKDILHLLPSFRNLTLLNVDWGASDSTCEVLMDILQKTHNLEVLVIPEGLDPDTCLDGDEWILNSVPCCFKSCLKLFIIQYFEGSTAQIQ